MHQKTIVVKKCKVHRIGIVVFSIVMLAILTACVAVMRTPSALLFYIPALVILSPLVLYYLTWQIRFEKKGIVRCVLGRKTKRYSFGMLRGVMKNYYVSERNVTVRMHFSDGKTLQFRMDDDYAVQGVKILQKHCSIKTP